MKRRVCVLGAALLIAMLSGCEREQRRFDPATPPSAAGEPALQERNAYDVSQGKRLYRWYNCSGCHAAGGGSIGPPLMDARWRYGGETPQIVQSILQGRPGGMPAFGGRIPDEQAWKIAAYVRSMSGQLRTDVAANRGDTLSSGPPESRRSREDVALDPTRPASASIAASAASGAER
ncbi:MAG TPA: cytochrome c [Burkholderiaceae bacterium]